MEPLTPDPVGTVQWMTIAEAVDRTGVTTTQLRRWIRKGRVTTHRHNRRVVSWESVVDEQRDSRLRRRGAGRRHAEAGRNDSAGIQGVR